MSVKSISFSKPFSWIDASVGLMRNNPNVILGAAALMLVVVLIPAVLQQIVLRVVQPASLSTVLAIVGFFMLVNLALFAPMFGGFYRLLHACAQGQPARATDVFALFREPAAAGRMIAVAALLLLINAVALAVANAAIGEGYLLELAKAVLTAKPGTPPVFPPAPNGIALWFVLFVIVFMALKTVHLLAMGQAALTPRSPPAAVGDGFTAALSNLAAFVAFYLALCVVVLLFALIVGLVIGLIAVILAMISTILAFVVLVPIYLALMLVLYAVMFGFCYFAWRDTLGDDTAVAQLIAV
jgi:hypothetical protein